MTNKIIDTGVTVRSPTYTGPGTLDGNCMRAGGVANSVAGYFTSDGNAVDIMCSFRPVSISIVNETDGLIWQRQFGMLAANAIKTTTAATVLQAVDTASQMLVNDLGGGTYSVTLGATLVGTAKKICFLID